MKYTIKNIAIILFISFMIFSCVEEDKFINPVHFQLENGAFAKFTETPPTVIDFIVPEEAVFSQEIIDANNNITEYRINMTGSTSFLGDVAAENIFVTNSLPTNFTISAQDIANILEIQLDQIEPGDSFNFVAIATRNDGTEFSGENASYDADTQSVGIGMTDTTLNAEGGYFSAMKFGFTYVCPVEEGLYTGTYLYENIVDTVNGPVFGTGPFTVEISVVEDTGNVGRSINVNYLADLGIGQDNINFRFNLICGLVIAEANQGTNLTCGGGGILLGPSATSLPYDLNDDSVIEILFDDGWDGNDGGCGFAPTPVRIKLTKQ